jgi:hypothetical protein
MTTYLLATASLLLAVQTFLLWRVVRATGEIRLHGQRLGHFGDALAHLAETRESGFRAVGTERSNLATGGPLPPPRRFAARPIVTTARGGHTEPEYTADTRASHGEVRLRLQLADLPSHESALERVTRTPPGAEAASGANDNPLRS